MYSFHFVTVIGGKVVYLRMTITSGQCAEGEYDGDSFWNKLKEGVTIVFKCWMILLVVL